MSITTRPAPREWRACPICGAGADAGAECPQAERHAAILEARQRLEDLGASVAR